MKHLLTLLLMCGVASAELNAIGKARTLTNRIDATTAGNFSLMDHVAYMSCVLWQAFSHNDNSGANYYDLSASTNDGAQTTEDYRPTFSTTVGGCYIFDGTNDGIELQHGLIPTSSPATISFWMNHDDDHRTTACRRPLSFADAGTSPTEHWFIDVGPATGTHDNEWITIRIQDNEADASLWLYMNTNDQSGVWHHVCITASGSVFALYVDGSVRTITPWGDGSQTSSHNGKFTELLGTVGYASVGKFTRVFDGKLDDARIFNRVLSSNESYNIYMAEPTAANGGKR